MGHFFYGAILGFLFSSLAYLVVLLVIGAEGLRRLGSWRFFIELILVGLVTAGFFWWARPDLDWVGRYEMPTKVIQIVLGAAVGVLVRVWLTRLLILFHRDAPLAAAHNRAPEQPKASPAKDGEFALRQEWIWAIGFLVVSLIAIMLPYLEDMVKHATTIKVGTVEVSLKSEQQSQYLATLAFSRDKSVSEFLSVHRPEEVQKRLESDNRNYPDTPAGEQRREANRQYVALYAQALYPFLSCTVALFNQGWDLETVKSDARRVAREWFVLANAGSTRGAGGAKPDVGKLADAALGVVDTWAKVTPECKRPAAGKKPDGRATESFEFYRLLSYLMRFLDNRLGAIVLLERVGDRFSHELNWPSVLGLLYYDEDPTLTKTVDYYEQALGLAIVGLDAATARVAEKSIKCAADKLPAPDQAVCDDQKRYRNATLSRKNAVAYFQAQSGRGDLARARRLAKEVFRSTLSALEKGHDYSRNKDYWSHLDTYAYVVMIDTIRRGSPDLKIIACAEKTFGELVQHAGAALDVVLRNTSAPGFRADFLTTRYHLEGYSAHRAMAANLLVLQRGGECSEKDPVYRDLQAGNL